MTSLIKNDKVLRVLDMNKLLFKIVFMILMILTAVPYLHMAIGSYVRVMIVWGGATILLELLSGAKLFFNKLLLLLLGFAASYAVTIVYYRGLNFDANIKQLIYMVIIFILIFGYDLSRPAAEMRKEVTIVTWSFVIATFTASLICFITYAFSIHGYYRGEDGSWLNYGLIDNRLWGLYNANTGSTINNTSMILTIALLAQKGGHKLRMRIFCAVNLFLQFSCQILTGSRTAVYVFLIGTALLAFYLIPQFVKPLQVHNLKNYVLRVTSAILVVVCVFGASQALRYGLSYIPGTVKYFTSSSDVGGEDNSIEQTNLDRVEEFEHMEGGFLNGRIFLWTAGVKTWEKSPIWGVTRENIYEMGKNYVEGDNWHSSLRKGGIHNIYVTILASSGLLGSIIMLIFIILSLIKMLKSLYKKQILDENKRWFICCFVLLAMFAVTECFEARILYQVGVFYIVFWLYYGYAIYFSEKREEINEKAD